MLRLQEPVPDLKETRYKARGALRFVGTLVLLFFWAGHSKPVFAKDASDFRLIRWGMTRFEVIASETLTPVGFSVNEILYQVLLFDRPTSLVYRFHGGRVVGARYVLPTKPADDIEKLSKLIAIRYGPSGSTVHDAIGADRIRVWNGLSRTVRLYLRPEGEAIIDILSSRYAKGHLAKKYSLKRQLQRTLSRSF